jgi:serine/threonine-protein kinase RsbW
LNPIARRASVRGTKCHFGVARHSEIPELTTASRRGKLQNPEEFLPQASATPGVGDTSLFMTAQSKVSYRMESTLESVNKAEEMADQIAAQSGFDEDVRGGISMAVREAMINAVLHGNAYDPAKRVNLTFEQNSRELIITIGDEGRGLEPDEIPDPLAPENLMKQSGRGIFLIRAFMDEVRFRKLEPGTEITLIKRIPGSELDRQEAST